MFAYVIGLLSGFVKCLNVLIVQTIDDMDFDVYTIEINKIKGITHAFFWVSTLKT